jgi:hypothetical protein
MANFREFRPGSASVPRGAAADGTVGRGTAANDAVCPGAAANLTVGGVAT